MPIMRMPNGEYVNIEDGTPPEVVERIKSDYRAPAARTASPRQAAPAPKQEARSAFGTPKSEALGPTFAGRVASSLTFGLSDKLDNAVRAGFDMLRPGNKSTFRDAYQVARQDNRAQNATYDTENPIRGNAALIAGALLNPVGAETGAGRLAARFAPKVAKAAKAVPGARLLESSIARGARAGLNQGAIQGALNAADDPNGDVLNTAKNEALTGAAGGAIFGAAAGALGKAGDVLNMRKPQNAKDTAYRFVDEMMQRSTNPATGKAYTPEEIANNVRVADKGGGDSMFMDYIPEARNTAGHLASKPGLAEAGNLERRVTDRSAQAGDRFVARVEKDLPGPSAFTAREAIEKSRKEIQQAGYKEGSFMDEPLVHTPDMDKWLREAPPITESALKAGYMDRLNRREMPAGANPDPNGTFTHIPDLRTFDYVKRGFDAEIGKAIAAKDNPRVQALTKELSGLKDMLGEANPQYRDFLQSQRDLYQIQNSVDVGDTFLRRIVAEPEKLFKDIKHPDVDVAPLRAGVADAMISLQRTGGQPAAKMASYLRSPKQRKVMAYIFGSNAKLKQFEIFLQREADASRTDRFVNPTAGSKSAPLLNQGAGGESAAGAQMAEAATTGYAYGGPVGGASKLWRAMKMLSSGLSKDAEEELARILSGKGGDLRKGIDSAKAHAGSMEAARKVRSEAAGKMGRAAFGGYAQD